MNIEQEIYNKLVEQFGISEVCIKKWGKRKQLTWLQFINISLKNSKISKNPLYEACNFSSADALSYYFRNNFPTLVKDKDGRHWYGYFLSLLNLKWCYYCDTIQDTSNFYIVSNRSDNLGASCKNCEKLYREDNKNSISSTRRDYYYENRTRLLEDKRQYYIVNKDTLRAKHYIYYQNNKHIIYANNAKRRASKLQATPNWADQEKIKEIYKNCPPGDHVDHWAPLKGDLVCGLHVHENLQYLTAAENLAKSNKFEVH